MKVENFAINVDGNNVGMNINDDEVSGYISVKTQIRKDENIGDLEKRAKQRVADALEAAAKALRQHN